MSDFPPKKQTENYFYDLMLGMKSKLSVQTSVDKYALLDHAFDCGFHTYVKQDLTMQFTPEVTKKVEFTEHNDPGSTHLEVRAEVYVLSVEEVKRLARDVNGAIGRKDDEIKRLQGILDSPMLEDECVSKDIYEATYKRGKADGIAQSEKTRYPNVTPESAVTAAQFLAQTRLIELNAANARAKRLEKELLHVQELSLSLAMFTPPPIIFKEEAFVEGFKKRIKQLEDEVAALQTTEEWQTKNSRLKDKKLGELEASRTFELCRVNAKTDIIIERDKRIKELEGFVSGLKDQINRLLARK